MLLTPSTVESILPEGMEVMEQSIFLEDALYLDLSYDDESIGTSYFYYVELVENYQDNCIYIGGESRYMKLNDLPETIRLLFIEIINRLKAIIQEKENYRLKFVTGMTFERAWGDVLL